MNPLSKFLRKLFERSLPVKRATKRNGFDSLVSGVKDYAIIVLDVSGRMVSWNDGAEKMIGYAAKEAIGKTLEIVYDKADISKGTPWQNLEKVKQNGRVERDGWRIKKDGSMFYGTATANTVKNDKGEISGLVFVVKDISISKQLEEQLRKSNEELEQRVNERSYEVYKNEKRFRALVENNHSIITLFNKDWIPIYRSPAAERITGWTADDRNKISILDQIHPEQRAAMANVADQVAKPWQAIFFYYKIASQERSLYMAGRCADEYDPRP